MEGPYRIWKGILALLVLENQVLTHSQLDGRLDTIMDGDLTEETGDGKKLAT